MLARAAIASYLRECGHRVIEASSEREARDFVSSTDLNIDIAICAVPEAQSASGFELARWIRSEKPNIRVLLAATVEKTAKLAADICEEGPHLRRPYEPQALLDWIKRLRA
ncbi:MAG TPA: response regulator [Lacipirellulaceae bacterium]|nr:response regulator [Lacipirellulaceae bacterium]